VPPCGTAGGGSLTGERPCAKNLGRLPRGCGGCRRRFVPARSEPVPSRRLACRGCVLRQQARSRGRERDEGAFFAVHPEDDPYAVPRLDEIHVAGLGKRLERHKPGFRAWIARQASVLRRARKTAPPAIARNAGSADLSLRGPRGAAPGRTTEATTPPPTRRSAQIPSQTLRAIKPMSATESPFSFSAATSSRRVSRGATPVRGPLPQHARLQPSTGNRTTRRCGS